MDIETEVSASITSLTSTTTSSSVVRYRRYLGKYRDTKRYRYRRGYGVSRYHDTTKYRDMMIPCSLNHSTAGNDCTLQ